MFRGSPSITTSLGLRASTSTTTAIPLRVILTKRYISSLSPPLCSYCTRESKTRSWRRRPLILALSPIYNQMSRRVASSKPPSSPIQSSHQHNDAQTTTPGHSHNHEHGHDHDHDHSHGIFHTHAHDHSEGAEQLINALQSRKLDRGTRITLLGLGSNIGLTVTKGLAGLYMNSASLLAEAGHSLSDLLGDFVTLATWRISRKTPTDAFPWGYSKFETFGTLSVSVILIGGAIGIGLHSYHLLLQTLLPYLETFPADSTLATIGRTLPHGVPSPLLELFHSHGPSALPHEHAHGAVADLHDHSHSHSHSHAAGEAILNPHAAWFALASVAVKEWLYRLTTRVAAEEHSPVLKANALHHRADALTSLVALVSILGSSFGGYTFLDPLGGIAVSFFILQQGLGLSKTAFFELLDAGVDGRTQKAYVTVVEEMINGDDLLGVRNVRGVKSGGQTHLDLTITVPPNMTVRNSHAVETRVRDAILKARREVREVKIHVHAQEDSELLVDPAAVKESEGASKVIKSDFGGDGC